MDTYSPQKLPFFPQPYPGESLYSVLCRYHVRSGNATAVKTIRQLFGRIVSLSSSLLLPTMLNCLDSWYMGGSGTDTETLLHEHTAFSLYTLKPPAPYEYYYPPDSTKPAFTVPTGRKKIQQRIIQHPSQQLRYCPVCAREQRIIYGEAYWQILPQLDGVEYCPTHKARIACSSVHFSSIQRLFYPADMILRNDSADYSVPRTLWYHENKIRACSDLFISMANVVLYLWKHLLSVNGIWYLLSKYRQAFSPEPYLFWQSTRCVSSRLLQNNPADLVNWTMSTIFKPSSSCYVSFGNLPLSGHALMISMLTPSPEDFWTGKLL